MTEPIEPRLQALAQEFQYPPTPSVAEAVMKRIRVPVKRIYNSFARKTRR